ncbi:MAG: serine/threonine-protein phosphatase [Candidatus Eremiobacteraeota bacterium]|nr:serine/threonine-protein phosphatase [Candidatus Eremiobacteraeota bacterium]
MLTHERSLLSHPPPIPTPVLLHDDTAAEILVRHLFAQPGETIVGIDFDVGYTTADGPTGGDIIDVFPFDNQSVGFSIADISGKGVRAAVHAAQVKYALRAYASAELPVGESLYLLNRLLSENNAFERLDTFASVFIGVIDSERNVMTYASGGHEPVVLLARGRPPQVLAPTAPILGVFENSRALFGQEQVQLRPGSVLVATTDGVTEARRDGVMYGIDRLVDACALHAREPAAQQVESLMRNVSRYCYNKPQDDIAILVARIA